MNIKDIIQESIDTKQKLLIDEQVVSTMNEIVKEFVTTLDKGGQILFCGNGGSAADAQHFAAELTGRFYLDRKPLNAEALHTNTSFLTAVANDYSFDIIFSRLVEAKGKKDDILVAISTSGNSTNIVNAVIAANNLGMKTIGMTGSTGGKLNEICKYMIKIPSNITPRIQEAHILTAHIICQFVEEKFFTK